MNEVGFVLISTGPFSRTYKAEVCLESLYKVSGYTGKSFLITDSPECHNLKKIRKVCNSDKVFIKTVKRFSHHWDSPIAFLKKPFLGMQVPKPVIVNSPKKRFKAKALKAEVFNLIDDEDIKVLIYVDADSVFLRKEGLDDLLSFAHNGWEQEGMRFRVDEWDDDNVPNSKLNIHTGFYIAHREFSKRALAHWGKNMSIMKYWILNFSDKEKYLRGYNDVKAIEGKPNYMTVDPIPQHKYETFFDPDNDTGLIGHITGGRIRAHGKERIEQYLANLNLRSYPEGYYTMPGFPKLIKKLYFFGYTGRSGAYKIEDVWRRIRIILGKDSQSKPDS